LTLPVISASLGGAGSCVTRGFRLPAADLCVAQLAGPGGLDVRVGVPLADAYLEFLGRAVPTEYGASGMLGKSGLVDAVGATTNYGT
jgi:hypothetical protein